MNLKTVMTLLLLCFGLKSPFLLRQLMLPQPTDTLLGDDAGAPIVPPDPASTSKSYCSDPHEPANSDGED